MTVEISVGAECQTIKMVKAILEHHYGLYRDESKLCFITADKTYEFDRSVTWNVVEIGLDPHYYDAKEQKIERAPRPAGLTFGSKHAKMEVVARSAAILRKKQRDCLVCGKPSGDKDVCDKCGG